jgi:hypothetical protein
MLADEADTGTSCPKTFEDDWCGDGEPNEASGF